MKRFSLQFLLKSAMIAAVYAVLTLALQPISYGMMQVRISELLVLLAFISPRYIPGLTLGCFLANLLGPFGIVDAIFGTGHTFLSLCIIWQIAKHVKHQTAALVLSSLAPSLMSFVIAFEMSVIYMDTTATFWGWYGWVALGEFIIVCLVSVPVYKLVFLRPNVRKVFESIAA